HDRALLAPELRHAHQRLHNHRSGRLLEARAVEVHRAARPSGRRADGIRLHGEQPGWHRRRLQAERRREVTEVVMRTTLAIVAGFLIAAPAFAHHGFDTEYDATKKFTLSGVVQKVEWQNPHM